MQAKRNARSTQRGATISINDEEDPKVRAYKEHLMQQRLRSKSTKKSENIFGFGVPKARNTQDKRFNKLFTMNDLNLPEIKARDYSNEPMVRVGTYAHL